MQFYEFFAQSLYHAVFKLRLVMKVNTANLWVACTMDLCVYNIHLFSTWLEKNDSQHMAVSCVAFGSVFEDRWRGSLSVWVPMLF